MKSIILVVVGCALGITIAYGLTTIIDTTNASNTTISSTDLLSFRGTVEEHDSDARTILLHIPQNNFQQNPTKILITYNTDTKFSRTDGLVQEGYFFGVQDSKPILPNEIALGDTLYIIRNSDRDTKISATYITILNPTL